MGVFIGRLLVISAALLLLGSSTWVRAEEEDADDGVQVEAEEDLYVSPKVDPKEAHFAEHFDDAKAFQKRWIKSEAKKQGVDDTIAKYDGKWEIKSPIRKILKDDLGLVLTTEAKHAAIAALLDKPFEFTGNPLVVQYEVTLQEGQNCGGAYLKLLSKGTNTKADLRKFHDQTPYTIMFGPDKCGNDNKLHFIFRHQNPKNGTIEEKHSKKPTVRLDDIYKDKEPHLYTLIVRPDNTFSILIDNKEVNAGSLLEDFTPAVNPPEEVDDPDDRKPDDWDEREKIVDPSASKPDDWDDDAPAQIYDQYAVKPAGWLDDEPKMISDPNAKKPDDWDEDMDGEWEAPLIDNPACESAPGCGPWSPPTIPNPDYKGIWRAPLIPNPNYKGKWSPRRIPNPHYFRDETPYKMTPIHAVGFELWSMSPQLLFDNLIITDDPEVAANYAAKTFALKRAKLVKDSDSFLDRSLSYAAENPWVYFAVIIGTFLMVGFIVYLCWGGSKDEVLYDDPKKSDAYTEDDPQDEQEEEETSSKRPKGKAHLEETKEEVTTTAPVVDDDGAGDGQRKRKPRKE